MNSVGFRKFNYIADKSVIIGVLFDFGYEASVNLDFAYIKLFQVTEVGIARTEIVDGKAHAVGLYVLDKIVVMLVSANLNRFGKLHRKCISGKL